MRNFLKVAGVIFGAVILTTVAIGASDSLQNVSGGLPGLLMESGGPCAEGSVPLFLGTHSICVDVYEASAGENCPYKDFDSVVSTESNLASQECAPVSAPDKKPWSFVSLNEAQQLCARAGKRLPTNEEWFKAVSGLTTESGCVVNKNNVALTGSADCVSPAGTVDQIGNVWEWIEEEIHDGKLDDRNLPGEGYVQLADVSGIALETNDTPNDNYGNDYAWINPSGVRGLIRGGFFGAGTDAGLYSVNAAIELDLKTAGIGFRCVKDLY